MSDVPATPAPAQPAATATDIAAVAIAAPKGAPAAEPKAPAQPKPPTAPKVEAPAAKAPPTSDWHEVSVDGKKLRVSLEDLKREYTLKQASFSRFEEAANMRKQADEVLGRLKDPNKALELLTDPKYGLSEDQVRSAFEKWYTDRVITRAEMTPEQRELSDAKARLKAYEEQEAKKAQDAQSEQEKQKDSQLVQQLQTEILQTLEESKLPKTKFTMNRIAYWTRVNEAKGLNAPRELIIGQVKKEMREVVSTLLESSDGDMLFDVLGPNTVKKVRSHDLARIRAQRTAPKVETPKPESSKSGEPEFLTEMDVKKRLRELWK